MPAGNSQRNPLSETTSTAHPTKATHIRNKDGTKLITVPSRKVSNSADTSAPPPSPTPSNTASSTMPYTNGASAASKKKNKKKRGKQQQQQEQTLGAQTGRMSSLDAADSGHDHHRPTSPSVYQQEIRNSMAAFGAVNGARHPDMADPEDDEDYYSDQDGGYGDEEPYSPPPHAVQPEVSTTGGKKKKKKNKKKGGNSGVGGNNGGGGNPTQLRKGKDRIWNTSTAEERERIKDFWLSLGEDERKSLVKVEKEAVLKKMKEQQKHSCSCSVCGRKRNAIEEELEVLYDAYYEELEQYANQQQTGKFLPPGSYASNAPSTPPPLGSPPPPRREYLNRRIEDLDDDDEQFDEEDQYEETDGLDRQVAPPNDLKPDFFNFGNSLTVQGGILTVADDLLKNDGKKFIEMMEQLAERRMQREEEANAATNGNHPMSLQMHPHTHPHTHAHTHSHNHPGQPEYDDEEDYDEEDEESEDDDYDEEEDEQDTMTEEQRMEEGRRMFQIFAARMFEQRVLTAYREKVARERQQKLLEELEEENRQQVELEQKRALAKDRQKEKKRLQKLAKEEEAKRKAAEKAAEEAERKEQEARKAEEQRKRKEEQRLKREAEKKAALEEKQRQEEERKRRVQEEREREAERERKKKEHQEREKKRKEEQARKAKEEKEAREKEARERKEREDRERKEREVIAKKEAEEQERAKQEQENKARAEAAIAAIAARTTPSGQSQAHSKFGSPHLSCASPAIPQTGALGPRPRNSSQQDGLHASQTSSPKTPSLAPRMGSGGAPSTPVMSHLGGINMPSKPPGFNNLPSFPPTSPMPQNIAPPPGVPPPEGIFGSMSPISMGGQMGFMPGMGHRPSLTPSMPGFPPTPFGAPSPSFRGFAHPVGQPLPVSSPPGMQMPIGAPSRPFMDMPTRLPPGVPIGPPASPFANRVDPVPMSSHNRVPSGGFEPISRPTPIQRPSSVAPKHIDEQDNGVEEISKVMGSRALLEDDDVMPENVSPNRRSSLAQQYAPRPIRTIPMASPIFSNGDVFGDASWSNPRPLGGTSGSLPSTWANPGAAWADMDMFNTRRRPGRHNQLRLLACTTYRDIAGPTNQFIEVANLEHAIHSAAPDLEFTSDDLTAVLEAVGDASNGGGNFIITSDATGKCVVALETMESVNTPFSVGEIGSPRIPGAVPFRQQPFAGQRPFPSSPAAAGFTSFG